MIKYEDNLTSRINGNNLQPLQGASVTVTSLDTGLPASLYSDNGVTPLAQPLTTDNLGYFGFYAPDGKYKLTFSGVRFATFTRQIVLEDPADNPYATKAELAAGTGSALVTFTQAGAGSVPRTVADKLSDLPVSVADYGASTANTAAQNDAAFAAACAAIMARGGGRLVVPPGVYQVCHQTRNSGGAYGNTDSIVIHDCARTVVIEGYGAKLVMPDGQKFGSFDPVTGNAYNPGTLPFWTNSYAGHPGRFIYAYNNASVVIAGFELDGNNTKYVVGGQYGDTGYQVIGNGIELDNNDRVLVHDVHVHHCGLDGIDLKGDSLTDASTGKPVLLMNVRSEYNARQGLSIEGGIGITVMHSKFNHTGRAVNVNTGANLYSSPGAGVDIEPIPSTVARNIALYSCECVNNVGYGLASDVGDAAYIALHNTLLWGTTNYSMKPTHPYTELHHCRVIGQWIGPYAGDVRAALKNYNTSFSDTPWQDGKVAGKNSTGYLVNQGSAKGVLYRDCQITATYQKLGDMRDAIIERCTFVHAYGGLADKSDVLDLRGAALRDVQIIDAVTAPTANGYYVQVDNSQSVMGRCEITYSGASGKLKWATWDSAAGGFQGIFGTQADSLTLATRYLVMHKDLGTNNATANIFIFSGTTAPTFGTWVAGSRCLNSAPTVGQPKGWVCTASGSPGTWVSEGNL